MKTVHIVYGPPLAGKSTFVRENMGPDDLVFDMDAVQNALCYGADHAGNYYKIQNAVDYGIPQNRERCFMISLLGDYYYTFPEPAPLETCALDYLEERVPDRYYLTADDLETKLTYTYKDAKTVSGGICKNAEGERHERASVCIIPFCICAGKLQGHKYEKWLDIARRVYDAKGVSPRPSADGTGPSRPSSALWPSITLRASSAP